MLSGLSVKRATLVPSIAVVATNDTQLHAEIQASVYAGIRIDADDTIYASDADGVYTAHNTNYVRNGTTAEVWVERTINSGSLTTDGIGASRVVCSTDRLLECLDTTDNGSPVAANVTVDFYDAASSGTLLDSVTYSLSAERLGV